jgi:[acyl-carrier-protein] S-malonyltransferase
LKDAGVKLGDTLDHIDLNELKIPYVTNVTAKYVSNIHETKDLLVKQVYSPVRWEQSVRNMIADGVDLFVEIGPGKTIAGFLRKIDKSVKCVSISKYEDLEKLSNIEK